MGTLSTKAMAPPNRKGERMWRMKPKPFSTTSKRRRPTRMTSVNMMRPRSLRIFSLSNCKRSSPLKIFLSMIIEKYIKKVFLVQEQMKRFTDILHFAGFFRGISFTEKGFAFKLI
jgi:hypothetical protein